MKFDVVVLGAGASGLMCAMTAAKRGRSVCVVDRSDIAGRKILVSGGGKCNFTNMELAAANYVSSNPHFVKSALARWTQWDTISLLSEHGITYEERDHGRLFTENGAKDIVDLFIGQCAEHDVTFMLNSEVQAVAGENPGFSVITETADLLAESLVIALGGKAWPQVGATGFGLDLARRFGLSVIEQKAGLAPLKLARNNPFKDLSGLSRTVVISVGGRSFEDDLLFTHWGVSGPAALQASLYHEPGLTVSVDFLPGHDVRSILDADENRRTKAKNVVGRMMQDRLAEVLCAEHGDMRCAELGKVRIENIAENIHCNALDVLGVEGFAKAEVALGGVDTNQISSKTMEAGNVPGLYCIGEVLDVAGQLGGYNLQWAWASGHVAGLVV